MLTVPLRQLPLTRLLIVGFSLMLLCLLVTIGANLVANAQHQASTDLLIDHLYPARRSAETLVRLAVTIDDEGARYLLSHNPSLQAHLSHSYQQDLLSLRLAIDSATVLADTPQQRAPLDDLTHYFFDRGGYADENQYAFVLKEDGQFLTASDAYARSPFLPTIQQDVQIYSKVVEQEIAQEDARQDSLAHLVLLLNLGIGGCAMFVGLAIAVFITRAIHRLYRQLEEQNSRLQALSTTDPLSELPNQRSLLFRLGQELHRAQASGHPCSVLFVDLDAFKAINDRYGHSVGDGVLCDLAEVLRRHIRPIDIAGRLGGEEFIAILPETHAHDALDIAEHLRTAVSFHPFGDHGSLHLTCSIGVACSADHGTDQEALLAAADAAMYGAKHLGRNQVRRSTDPAVTALLTKELVEGGREAIALRGTVEALVTLVEGRDGSLGHHSQQVRELVSRLARALGLSAEEAQDVALAGVLHDIGKVAVADAILQKPGPLTEQEWVQMRKHSLIGARVLEQIPSLRSLAPIIRAHHERFDGQGYPDQLKGEQIPLAARLIGVVDTYAVMTTDRPYQQARSSAEACAELRRCAGAQFDPQIVQAFIALLHEPQQDSWQGLAHART